MGETPAAFATSLMLGILLLCFTQKLYATFWLRRNPVLLIYSPKEYPEQAYQDSSSVPARADPLFVSGNWCDNEQPCAVPVIFGFDLGPDVNVSIQVRH